MVNKNNLNLTLRLRSEKLFELEQFCLDCRQAMKETDPQRAVREIVAREVADPISLMKAIGEPERAGVNTLHSSDALEFDMGAGDVFNATRP